VSFGLAKTCLSGAGSRISLDIIAVRHRLWQEGQILCLPGEIDIEVAKQLRYANLSGQPETGKID